VVRWFDLLPSRQGDLNHLVLGVRSEETPSGCRLVPVTISLYELFHTIVAASSGWGKSVFANAILAQLATCPDPVEFVLIDQQEHGLAAFKQCDRLRYPLLRQPEEILLALREVYREATEQRSVLFARYDADDLAEYNRRADAADYLPPIVVAVDEASALLANKDIGAELKRHAWELRKFGVYQILILTSAKGTTIDTDHRQQFSSKVQLHANERTQARLLIEDALDATTFPPGRAMIDLPGQLPAVVQTPYIDKREVRALLRPAALPPVLPSLPAVSSEPARPELSEEQKDQLFKQRVEAGWSRNAASLEAYGRRYAGDLVQRGKRVLGEI
jgi:DNA segregation ATPase FtsK/SpoIIIE-like protein